jgi:hypothetical protein
MNSPVVSCETGTLPISGTRRSIQGRTRCFCRVSYIGLTAATRKHQDTRSVPNVQVIPIHFNPASENQAFP